MEFWVSYKLIGGFGLTFIYVAITITYLNKKGYLENQKQGLDGESPEIQGPAVEGPNVEEPNVQKDA